MQLYCLERLFETCAEDVCETVKRDHVQLLGCDQLSLSRSLKFLSSPRSSDISHPSLLLLPIHQPNKVPHSHQSIKVPPYTKDTPVIPLQKKETATKPSGGFMKTLLFTFPERTPSLSCYYLTEIQRKGKKVKYKELYKITPIQV